MASDTRTGVIMGSTANVVRRHREEVRIPHPRRAHARRLLGTQHQHRHEHHHRHGEIVKVCGSAAAYFADVGLTGSFWTGH